EHDGVAVQFLGALLVGSAQRQRRGGLGGHGVIPHQSHTKVARMRAARGKGARSTHSFGACGAFPAVTPYKQHGVAPPCWKCRRSPKPAIVRRSSAVPMICRCARSSAAMSASLSGATKDGTWSQRNSTAADRPV